MRLPGAYLLRRWLDRLRSSLWFVPGTIVLAASALATAMVAIDVHFGSRPFGTLPLLFVTSAETARSTLSTIAGSMITVGGVVFSITIVVLTLAASQYSPRVIRNFMRDRISQMVLGVFLGVFAYCMLVLSTIEDAPSPFVPSLAIAVSMLLALVAMGHLVLYIHHIARAIQAAHILASAAHETLDAIDCVFPRRRGTTGEVDTGTTVPPGSEPSAHVLCASRTGYVQRIDIDALVACAERHDVVMEVACQVGAFVPEGTPLLTVRGSGRSDRVVRSARDAFVIARFQTVEQDVGYGVRQMVDVALRALSPAMNDETTAAEAIDYIGAVLAEVASRPPASEFNHCEGHLRVIAPVPSFEWLLGLGFGQIVRIGAASPETLQRVLGALAGIRERACSEDRRASIDAQVRRVGEAARRSIEEPGARASTLRQADALLAGDSPDEHRADHP